MVFLGHVDTVLADRRGMGRTIRGRGEVADGFLWGRGALDMKSQVAAEAVGAVALARVGWRPARGALKLVFVADEETGGDARRALADRAAPRQGALRPAAERGRAAARSSTAGARHYGVCCGEKGIFRFKLTARGVAGHASMPRTGDNALLKLAPVLEPARRRPARLRPDRGAAGAARGARCRRRGSSRGGRRASRRQIRRCRILLEPMLGVTLTPTVVHASDKINVIPSRADAEGRLPGAPGTRRRARAERGCTRCWATPPTGSRSSSPRRCYGYESPLRRR